MKLALSIAVAIAPGVAAALPFEPSLLGDESYSEQFSAQVDLEDGRFLHVQLGLTNVGIGDGKAACRILTVSPGGQVWTENEKYDREDWQYAKKPYPQFQVGPCYFRGGFAVEAYLEVAGATVRVSFEAGPGSIRPPGHRVDAGDDFYESEIIIPWAPARVELTLPGKKKRVIRGFGYVDHSRSTAMPFESARRWARFRVLAESSLLLLARFPPGGGAPQGWLWRQGEDKPVSLGDLELTAAGNLWNLQFATREGTFRIAGKRLLYRHAPIEDIGFGASVVRKVVGDPVTKIMRGELSGPGFETPITGLMEVSDHKR